MKTRLIGFCLLAVSGNAFAFNCDKATLKTDFVICSSPELLQAEEALEKVWVKFNEDKDDIEKKAILAGQREWIKQYGEQCGLKGKGKPSEADIQTARPCVLQALKNRADYLQAQIEKGQVPPDVSPIEYTSPIFTPAPNAAPTQPTPPAPVSQATTPPAKPTPQPAEPPKEETQTMKLIKQLWRDWVGK